ncbi:uncharacterized protein UV8b_02430 [Ustilaginoidea virens]|uniref:Complex III subunit 9 n=1 Tax=Ustilaginoidea virens TaxID=1159556 RepID=A0A8E5HMP4_USTVR|nr:uncharacterized protein UV8b_02430 [Ustilaginoidea virens]QUC18189.1 hypothetical protein UV8b_02430 [Ustilaginoidea virens]
MPHAANQPLDITYRSSRLHEAVKMTIANSLYSVLFRKNSVMLAAVFGAGFVFEVGFNNVVNKWWDNHNRGRQWKDIRDKYVQGGEEDEE